MLRGLMSEKVLAPFGPADVWNFSNSLVEGNKDAVLGFWADDLASGEGAEGGEGEGGSGEMEAG